MNNPLVISVILNTNRKSDTLECLESLHHNTYPNQRIIVLDVHSTDGSVEAIRQTYPKVQIISLRENLGYAGNNNVGLQAALEQGADWVFVLNEDIVLDRLCLDELISVGEQDIKIGILGPMVYHHNEPNVIQSAGGMLGRYWESIHLGRNEEDIGQYTSSQHVEWISGCAILVRKSAIEQAGMLDQDYFIYWEEIEWCIRIARAGWKIVNVPQSKIWHKGVRRDYQPKPYITYYVTRNHLFTLYNHKAPIVVWIYTLGQILRSLISWTIKPQWRHKREHRNAMWHGLVDFIKHRQGPMPFLNNLENE